MKRWIWVGLAACTLMAVLGTDALGEVWQKTYGHGGSDLESGRSVQQTSDGGYIIAGHTWFRDTGDSGMYLIKTDDSGDTIWTQTYGVNTSAYSVQQTSDGGYIVIGSSGVGAYLIKTDAAGDTIWTRTYEGDRGYSVQRTSDGGYIIAGRIWSYDTGSKDVYLIKTDASGDMIWTRTYGGSSDEESRSVQQTLDGGYILAGYTQSYGAGSKDVYLIRTDASGEPIWTRTYGGSSYDLAYSVQQTSDGGLIVVGSTLSYGAGYSDVYLIKTDVSGNTIWTQTYGGSEGDGGYSVQQTSDGGYILAGYTQSYGAGSKDVYLIKTDVSGDTIWTRTYGGNREDESHSVQQTLDGGYILAGSTRSYVAYGARGSEVYLIKTDAEGVAVSPIPQDVEVTYVHLTEDVPVHYVISFPNLASRQIHVECQIRNFPGGDLGLRITESWAGAKHLFSNVRELHGEDAGGHALKVDMGYTTAAIRNIPPRDFQYTYILQTKQEKLMAIAEEEPTLNDEYCFVFGHALFLHPDRIDQDKLKFQVDFDLPAGWHIATSWGNDAISYRPESLGVLKHSEMALGDYRIYTEEVMGRPFTLAIRDRWPFTDQECFDRVIGYARYYADLFAEFPEPYFLIICNKGLPDVGGGDAVTHTISVALRDRGMDASAKTYYLSDSVIPHELFHIWNGHAMSAADYGEGYWFSEGVTNYYALVTAYRFLPRGSEQELRDAREFLEQGLSKFTSHYNRHPDARLDQVGYQAYTKGALVALILDAEIRGGSKGRMNLDDLMRAMYSRFASDEAGGYTNQDIFDLASDLAGVDLYPIYNRYIVGTDRLPLDEYLDAFRSWMADLPEMVTAVENELLANVPASIILSQNFPNPFNSMTVVTYALPCPSRVRLSIYNALSQRVRTLTDAIQDAGLHRVRWDSRDDGGRAVSSGIYVYRLNADGVTRTKRMVLVR